MTSTEFSDLTTGMDGKQVHSCETPWGWSWHRHLPSKFCTFYGWWSKRQRKCCHVASHGKGKCWRLEWLPVVHRHGLLALPTTPSTQSRINLSFDSLNQQMNKIQVKNYNSKAQMQREPTYFFWDYTHMKWDPSVSCGWMDGTGEDEDSGDGDRLFTKTHQENARR